MDFLKIHLGALVGNRGCLQKAGARERGFGEERTSGRVGSEATTHDAAEGRAAELQTLLQPFGG